MVTIKDIARVTGYIIVTVSRVINNKADVSEEARSRIENAIKELDFYPNANAKSLKQALPSGITVIVRGMNNRFLVSLLEEVQRLLTEHGESTNVVFLDEIEDEIEAAVRVSKNERPKGYIFLGGSASSFHQSFHQITIPSILVTGSAEDLHYDNLSSITTDDFAAAYFAVNKLLEQGHKRIGIIGGNPVAFATDNSTRRLQGAIKALGDKGAVFDKDKDYAPGYFSLEAGYESANQLLEQDPDITAVFALSDIVAFGAMRAFNDRGLKVPDDISICGFDGIDFVTYSVPRLTTVKQNVEEIAEKCVDDLLLRISYPRSAFHLTVPFSFIDGESVAPPKK
ncbi:MAG: LacI family DNA-binding transcriptional regulator [Oscillospiraceae bacterium]|nr:LacI family DNA-binding transcriptional regulator [Oscillospiraceae bacterium]